METRFALPRFSGVYRFRPSSGKASDTLNLLQKEKSRDQLCLSMKRRDNDSPHTPCALLDYQGQLVGFSGQDALDLMKACTNTVINTFYALAQKAPQLVLHSSPIPFKEATITQFLESKSKTLDNLDVIDI